MSSDLTDFLLTITFQKQVQKHRQQGNLVQHPYQSSQDIFIILYHTLYSQKNYKASGDHKSSFCSDQTNSQSPVKCNCKKSKCLKLYCECFAKGSFCKDCNCQSCNNVQQFSEIRAKAIDKMVVKTALPYGFKSMTMKGCNCKKTGCQKKYCECFYQGMGCNEYCKCVNCQNMSSS